MESCKLSGEGSWSKEEVTGEIEQRFKKLEKIKSEGKNPYQSQSRRSHTIADIINKYQTVASGEHTGFVCTLVGRLRAIRRHGKATFAVIEDGYGAIQLYLTIDKLASHYEQFLANLDIGDVIEAEGEVFKTRRGELSLAVNNYTLLSKSLRPLPEKWHGLKDIEARYRQRYVDLIVNPQVKEVFNKRIKIIRAIRHFLNEHGFLEVETPMLQPIPGGATARPFITYHNALDMNLYLRIAPELYLKRLIVGGYEKVYELNRSFRNEGISIKHNPEFTMLEVYQAYADYQDMLELTENLIKSVAREVGAVDKIEYQGIELNFASQWQRLTMLEALKEYANLSLSFDLELKELHQLADKLGVVTTPVDGKGKIIAEIFEKLVEPKIKEPTFVLDYPLEITPLAKTHPKNPNLVERFELIIAGREIANAFTELTDPQEQRRRFEKQVERRRAGDEEAQWLDEDFLRALEYGMPPTGGLGVGIDRLVMILTNSASIRDVLFFPHLRPEK